MLADKAHTVKKRKMVTKTKVVTPMLLLEPKAVVVMRRRRQNKKYCHVTSPAVGQDSNKETKDYKG